MKKYEITLSGGERHKVSADRVVIENGAVVFYGSRGGAREEVTAAWGPGQWQRLAALSESGNPVAKIGDAA